MVACRLEHWLELQEYKMARDRQAADEAVTGLHFVLSWRQCLSYASQKPSGSPQCSCADVDDDESSSALSYHTPLFWPAVHYVPQCAPKEAFFPVDSLFAYPPYAPMKRGHITWRKLLDFKRLPFFSPLPYLDVWPWLVCDAQLAPAAEIVEL